MPESYQLSNVIGFPILSILMYVPLAAALFLIFFVSKEKAGFIKWFSNIVAFIDMLISLYLIPYFDYNTLSMQFVERFEWIPQLGVQYFLGVDGISFLLVLLTTVLGFIAILSSWNAIHTRVKEYYVFMLILQTGMMGVFMALDFVLFYIFWEVMLVPMYFLIGVWGGARKLYAAIKFFLYTFLGSVLMLLGILTLYFYYHQVTGVFSFNILELMKLGYTRDIQFWVFLAFFVGFAIKVPMFPFHTWLPDAHVEAPTAGSVILAGVLLKMGTYGFVRFALPFLTLFRRKASVRYKAADRTCREKVFNFADNSHALLLFRRRPLHQSRCVLSMNVDTAARSLAETLQILGIRASNTSPWRVLINAQIGVRLGAANRKTFAHFETYRFWTRTGHNGAIVL